MFWPDNLPDDTELQLQRDNDGSVSLVEQLNHEGKLIWFLCDGDIVCEVLVFIDEMISEPLVQFCRDSDMTHQHYPRLLVRGGGVFGGMEYFSKDPTAALQKYGGLVETIPVPAGQYTADIYQPDIPDEWRTAWLDQKVGSKARKMSQFLDRLNIATIFCFLGSLILACALSWTIRLIIVGTLLLAIITIWFLSRTTSVHAASAAETEYEKEFPYYVVHLRSLIGE